MSSDSVAVAAWEALFRAQVAVLRQLLAESISARVGGALIVDELRTLTVLCETLRSVRCGKLRMDPR